jgi:hypothetical protein
MSLKSKPMSQVREIPAVSVLTTEEQVRINLNVSKSLRKKWKEEALKQETTMTELIIEAMKIYSNK